MFEVWSLYSATLGCYPEVIIFSDRRKGRCVTPLFVKLILSHESGLCHRPRFDTVGRTFLVSTHARKSLDSLLGSALACQTTAWFSVPPNLRCLLWRLLPKVPILLRNTTPNAISKATKVWIQYLTCSFKPDRTIPRSVVYSSLRPPPSSLSTVSQIHSLV